MFLTAKWDFLASPLALQTKLITDAHWNTQDSLEWSLLVSECCPFCHLWIRLVLRLAFLRYVNDRRGLVACNFIFYTGWANEWGPNSTVYLIFAIKLQLIYCKLGFFSKPRPIWRWFAIACLGIPWWPPILMLSKDDPAWLLRWHDWASLW